MASGAGTGLSLRCGDPMISGGLVLGSKVGGRRGWGVRERPAAAPILQHLVSVVEVSQTGDRGRLEQIQPLVMVAHVGGFVNWPPMSEVS